MNALPVQAAVPQPPSAAAGAQPTGLLAVLAPITALAAVPAQSQAASFDRTLQRLLDSAAALPTAGTPATVPAPAQQAQHPAADTDPGTDADGEQTLYFDPTLASLQPPPPTALPQPLPLPVAGQAGAAPAQPAPAAPAAIASAVQAAGAVAAALPAAASVAPVRSPAPAAPSPLPVAAAPAAPADAGALVLDRPGVAGAVPGLAPASAALPDDAVQARSGEAATPGRTPLLLQQLGDRIAVQLERGSERVVIRLDPPHRGQIEIHIRQDASGATQVQLSASHGDVVRQLQAIGDGLRQELSQRHGGDVSVQVAQQQARGDAEGRQRQGEQRQQQPGRALDDQTEAGQRFALAADRS